MSKKIKAILVVLIYIGLILINTKAYAISGKLLNETTRIRKEASTSSEVVDLISIGENFEIESEEGDWYKVKYKGKTGYIRKDMVEVEESTENSNTETNQTAENTETIETQKTENNETNQANVENKVDENVSNEQNQGEETKTEIKVEKGFNGKITSNLDIKIIPSIYSSVIATIYNDTQIEVKEVINKWAYIETENNSGWVLIGKINTAELNTENSSQESQEAKEENKEQEEQKEETKQEEVKEESKTEETKKEETKTVTKYVSTETLNMREKAENNATVVRQLKLNAEVTVVETVDSTWSKIKYKSSTGYVASKYLSDTKTKVTSRSEEVSRQQEVKEDAKQETTKSQETKKEETSSSKKEEKKEETKSTTSSSSSGSSVVSYAKQFLGNPYVYGGTSLTNGCDCSGFVMGVYKHFGVSLPHSSGSMRSVGTAVDKSNLQAGDIVCFSGHVGIYIGGNNFIHAANPSKGIIISSLSESYYKSKYICARRVN